MNAALDFLSRDAVTVARELIGWQLLVTEQDSSKTGGTIIETEAYNQDDAASHSYKGKTPRTEVMFGPAGRIYVYFTYGMHWCMNIVTGQNGRGEAVLIRAIVPEYNIAIMRARRRNKPDHLLTNGPAKICQALTITGSDNGQVIGEGKFELTPPLKKYKVRVTPRIGIKQDTHRLWRFIVT